MALLTVVLLGPGDLEGEVLPEARLEGEVFPEEGLEGERPVVVEALEAAPTLREEGRRPLPAAAAAGAGEEGEGCWNPMLEDQGSSP